MAASTCRRDRVPFDSTVVTHTERRKSFLQTETTDRLQTVGSRSIRSVTDRYRRIAVRTSVRTARRRNGTILKPVRRDIRTMRRRSFVRGVGAGSVIALSGCATRENGDEDEDDDSAAELPEDELEDDGGLRVATYSSMVAEETSAGRWLAEAFEAEFPDAEIDWVVPEAGIENYIQRAQLEAEMDADVYLGLTLPELVRVDESLSEPLFEPLERSRRENDDRSAIPTGGCSRTTSVSLVYDETFSNRRDVRRPPRARVRGHPSGTRPRRSAPGRAFLLWTIATFGDEYLAYWKRLWENGVDVRPRWTDAYVDGYLGGPADGRLLYDRSNRREPGRAEPRSSPGRNARRRGLRDRRGSPSSPRRNGVNSPTSSSTSSSRAKRKPRSQSETLSFPQSKTNTSRSEPSLRRLHAGHRNRSGLPTTNFENGWMAGSRPGTTSLATSWRILNRRNRRRIGRRKNGGESDDVPAENETADDETDRDTD